MDHTRNPTPAAGVSKRHYNEHALDDGEPSPDAAIEIEGNLALPEDEDTGGDPYNHTGRFKRSVR
jgi:hypothetical protein